MEVNDRVNPKYYNWLYYSVGGSFLLIGGYVYVKGGGIPLFLAMLIEWVLSAIIGGGLGSLIVAGIAKAMKRNHKNAFWATLAIMTFIYAYITLSRHFEINLYSL